MQKTSIQWTDFSANPLKYRRLSDGKIVWACVKHSSGCAHCYAETIALRFDRGRLFTVANMEEVEPFLDNDELRKMLTAKTVGGVPVSGSRCFVGDMTDIFGEWVPDEMIDDLMMVFALRPDVTFQVLTKRAARMAEYFQTRTIGDIIARCRDKCDRIDSLTPANAPRPNYGLAGRVVSLYTLDDHLSGTRQTSATNRYYDRREPTLPQSWPLPNLWLGVSVENQAQAEIRVRELLKVPAAVRFLSCEPLLERLDLSRWLSCPICKGDGVFVEHHENYCAETLGCPCQGERPIGLVIIGGESGRGARQCDAAWINTLIGQCKDAGTPVFVKQLGAHVTDMSRCVMWPNEVESHQLVAKLRDSHGGDMDEWPLNFRVREFPEGAQK